MSMILYNIRKRGPYEYDKFILNTFQLINEEHRMERSVQEHESSELAVLSKELEDIYQESTKDDNMLQQLLMLREQMGDIQ